MQKRRAQGLCFNCDEKFVVGHRCRKPQLLLLKGEEEEEEMTAAEELDISLHAFSGWSTNRSMKIVASINNQ